MTRVWLTLLLGMGLSGIARGDDVPGLDALSARVVGSRLNWEVSLIGLHVHGGGDDGGTVFDETANGGGVAVRLGGTYSPRLLGGHFGLRYGTTASVIYLRDWSTQYDDDGPSVPVPYANSEWMVGLHFYVGVQGLFGRTGADGVWRGVLLGLDYEPGFYLDGGDLIGGFLQLEGLSLQATWLTLDPNHARLQPTLRFTLEPGTNPPEQYDGAVPWMTMILIGVAWY